MEELKSIGSLAQLGAFGILSYIVYWTLKNVPGWVDASRKLRETEISSRETVAQAHKDAIAALVVRHEAQMQTERDNCERRHREMLTAFAAQHKEQMEAHGAEMERLRIIDHVIRDVAQSRASQDHLQKIKRGPRQGQERGEES